MKKLEMIVATAILTLGTIFGGAMTTTVCAAETASDPEGIHYIQSGSSIDSKGDQFVGSYACGRAFIQIEKAGDNYLVSSVWGEDSDNAFEATEWTYLCDYDEKNDSLVCTNKGTKMITTFSDDGEIDSQNITCTDGSGHFSHTGSRLSWDNSKEEAGSEMVFEKLDY